MAQRYKICAYQTQKRYKNYNGEQEKNQVSTIL